MSSSVTNQRCFAPFLVGLAFGFCFAQVFLSSTSGFSGDWLIFWKNSQQESIKNVGNDIRNRSKLEKHLDKHLQVDRYLGQKLYNETRVLCWVMTNPANHQKKARHVKRTWGKRCNKLLFMSSANDTNLETIALNVQEGRNNLWAKTKAAFQYIYDNHLDDADWFLKADDDTYMIVENLRYMLYPYSPATPIYFGCRFKPHVKQGYMSGGAGYVLSKEAVRRFVEKAMPDKKSCRKDAGGAEDVEIGQCLENVNVKAGDSRDPHGRGRFFPFPPQSHVIPGYIDKNLWFWDYIYYKPDEGFECCSDYAVSFHYIVPTQMYLFEYLIYRVHPYGVFSMSESLPAKEGLNENQTTAFTVKY